MRFRRAALIYNPVAGGGFLQPVQRAAEAARKLERFVDDVRLAPTEVHRRADALAREAVEAGCDLIAPCGGDGTVNEALQGMIGSDATLLPLPAGTANVLAWEAGFPVNPVKVATLAAGLTPAEVELGVVDFPEEGRRRYFLLMCGAGVDAGAVYRLNIDLKRRVGIGAYFWSGLQQLFRPFEPLKLRVNGETLECTLAVISKSRLYGGQLVLTPNAHLLDQRFDVACFRSQSPLRYTGYFAEVVTRTLGRFKGVEWRQGRDVELLPSESPEVYVQVDGELAGRLPARVRLGPERLRVLLPAAYCEQYPGAVADVGAAAALNG